MSEEEGKTWDNIQEVLKRAGLSVVFMDGNEVRILDSDRESVCAVDMRNPDDDEELYIIVSVFLKGRECGRKEKV